MVIMDPPRYKRACPRHDCVGKLKLAESLGDTLRLLRGGVRFYIIGDGMAFSMALLCAKSTSSLPSCR
jgi:hypothetical protein